jgi:hypothetical protein
VIKARTWFTLLSFSIGTIAATFGCGSDEATGGGGGASGSGGGGIIGASGKGGAVSRAGAGGGTSIGAGILGSSCAIDGDCGTGYTCVTAGSGKLGGSGPSQGLCTASCMSDAECTALEPGSGCVNMGTTAVPAPYCLAGCVQGDTADPSTKCQGRFDLACKDLANPTTSTAADPFCVPRCRMDAECGTGLFCSPRTGLCSKTKPTGDVAGTPCDANAMTNNCSGICVGFPDSTGKVFTGYCADLCSGVTPCEFSGTTPGGLCLGALSQNFGPLDEGFCEPTCSCTDDCQFPGHICRGWMSTESDLQTALNSAGLCFPPVMDGSVELTACEGGAGGASAGGAAAGGAAAGGAAAGGAAAGGAAPAGGGGATAVSGGGSGG